MKLGLEQDAVLTRDAFRATLELENNAASRLENVQVDVNIRSDGGLANTNMFGVRLESVTALTSVDGTLILAGNTTGTAKWLIVPTVDAAPTVATKYLVGGTLSYRLDGQDVSIPLSEVPITVMPSPRLELQYFHQRDVFADDPSTLVTEPSIPYSLAVMVQNHGYGTAKNFHITSAQPKIIDNQKGLFVDFNIIATEVAGQAVLPSFTVDFGDIDPGGLSIGQWLMTSSIQGLFIDYSATVEHVDDFGNRRTSLIDPADLSIHEMNHLVQAGGAFEDGKPDFLVNDIPDVNDYPDTLYLSDGSTNHVEVIEQGTPSGVPAAGNLQITLAAPMPSGWAYLRVPDPGNGAFQLTKVTRSDGVDISLGTNVWTTDRTFVGRSKPPKHENILHLLDYNSPGNYTLVYEPGTAGSVMDTNPPISNVASLPAASHQNFQVGWSGHDEGSLGQTVAGIAYYDIYVSANDGPFVPWLQKTPLVSSTYSGTVGSHYAFYSVATDANGNRELAHNTPDAETTVSLTNAPPMISVTNSITINEGDTLELPVTISDPDTDQVLTLALTGNLSPGIQLDAASHRITWATGEIDGPSTNILTLTVSDNGFPSLSTTATCTVIVAEVNTPPTLTAIPDAVVREEQTLTFRAIGSDSDFPANKLTYSLDSGAPAGTSIDPVTGVFTWTPTDTQGGQTNRITVIVTDNGVPSYSAKQSFNVKVRDTQPDFRLRLGSTNLFAGQSQSVPIHLRSGVELDQLDFQLRATATSLNAFRIVPLVAEVQSASIQPDGDHYRATVRFVPRALLSADDDVANLAFNAELGESAAALLIPSEVTGTGAGGESYKGAADFGRVFVVDRQPVLNAQTLTGLTETIVVYGLPGTSYVLEVSTGIDTPTWTEVQSFSLAPGEDHQVLVLPPTPDVQFFRCRETQ